MAVALDPIERLIATGSKDGAIILWDAADGKMVRRLKGHNGWVLTLDFDPSGKKLVSGGADHSAFLWDVETGRSIFALSGHEGWVQSAGFSPDGRVLATGGSDMHVRLWDVQTGQALWNAKAHEDAITGLDFSPDGMRLATAAGNSVMQSNWRRDRSVALWDLQTGHRLFQFEPHNNCVIDLAFSPDGSSLMTGSGDNTVRIHRAYPWKDEAYPGSESEPWEARVERFRRMRRSEGDWQLSASSFEASSRAVLQTVIGEVHLPVNMIPKMKPLLPIQERPKDCSAAQIDLSSYYNSALDETWQPAIEPKLIDLNLSPLQPGLHQLSGVRFDVRGVIQLQRSAPDWDWSWHNFPGQVEIALDRKFSRLHVLHAAMWADREEPLIGGYRLKYADGTQHLFHITLDRDLSDWLGVQDVPEPLRLAWTAEDPAGLGSNLRLFMQTYENPYPERSVRAIDFFSTRSNTGPFLVAMTVE
jgi:hypothetical protein